MRYLPMLFAGLLVQAASFAQDSLSTDLAKVVTATWFPLGISYELPTASKQSLYIHPHLAISAGVNWSSAFGLMTEFGADPALTLQYRHYYNRARRAQKGKRIERNSGNYLAALYDLNVSRNAMWDGHIEEENRRPIHTAGVVWGLQRNRAGRFSFGFQAGVGYFYTRGTEWDDSASQWKTMRGGKGTLLLNISAGWWLGRRYQ